MLLLILIRVFDRSQSEPAEPALTHSPVTADLRIRRPYNIRSGERPPRMDKKWHGITRSKRFAPLRVDDPVRSAEIIAASGFLQHVPGIDNDGARIAGYVLPEARDLIFYL